MDEVWLVTIKWGDDYSPLNTCLDVCSTREVAHTSAMETITTHAKKNLNLSSEEEFDLLARVAAGDRVYFERGTQMRQDKDNDDVFVSSYVEVDIRSHPVREN